MFKKNKINSYQISWMDGWRVDFSCFVSHNKVVAPPMDDVLAGFFADGALGERERNSCLMFFCICAISVKKKKKNQS